MEELGNLHKLKYEQDKVLKYNEEAQKSREKIKEDYVKLKTKLKTLPDQISEDTMVPIGNVAFFPGHLIHTNEIMVLLGDNWFVERSAKQSIEIIERRIKMVEQQVTDLQKEHEIISSRKMYTDEFMQDRQADDIKEITEELVEEDVQSPKKKGVRTAHPPKHSSVPRSVKFKDADDLVESIARDTSKPNADTIDHNELLARLNELEREEQEDEDRLHAEQMKRISEGKYSSPVNDSETRTCNDDMGTLGTARRHSKVKFKNDLRGCTSHSFDSDDDILNGSSSTITFTHTPHQIKQRERSASESDLRRTINSPADIFENFVLKSHDDKNSDKPLKSILKKDSRSNSNENLKLRPILKTSPEHQPGTPELSFDDRRPILKTPPDSQGSDRRPGTPEYMLSEDEPKSILKNTNGDHHSYSPQETVIVDDIDTNEPRPILKFLDVKFEDIEADDSGGASGGDETRSILKSGVDGRAGDRDSPILGESCSANRYENESRSSILKNYDEDGRGAVKASNEIPEKKKTILKKQIEEAISDRVVERLTQDAVVEQPTTPKTSSKRPVSKFKASRSGR